MKADRACWALLVGCLLVSACTGGSSTPTTTPRPAGPPPAGSPGERATATSSADPSEIPEPSTRNTLPPPPPPTRPAPSTAGPLTTAALPIPPGWRGIPRPGGGEEGYLGNGTWVHARDPRYAAYDVITLGCAQITRDDYPDPASALEGTYEDRRTKAPGIGLVLQFRTGQRAADFYRRYLDQVRACSHRSDPMHTVLVRADDRLIDRRNYPDGDWTEVGRVHGDRLTLIILSDPGHRITTTGAQRLLDAIG